MGAILDEMIFDFNVNLPRILYGGNTVIIDNVKQIILLSDSELTVYCGQRFVSVNGNGLKIQEIEEERVQVAGEVEKIQFFGTQENSKD